MKDLPLVKYYSSAINIVIIMVLYQKALEVTKSGYMRRWNLFEQLELCKHLYKA